MCGLQRVWRFDVTWVAASRRPVQPLDAQGGGRCWQRPPQRWRKIAVPPRVASGRRIPSNRPPRSLMSTATATPPVESAYPSVQLFIGGQWRDGGERKTLAVNDPATGKPVGSVAVATRADLDAACAAAQQGFDAWRKVPAFERTKTMREAARLLKERADTIARWMTQEQGKPLAESKGEILMACDIIEWFAEEGRRVQGRILAPRQAGVLQQVLKEPVGPVAAFTPWNFPINQVVRKLSAALATGCSIIVKAPEETPASPAELIRCFADAGVPAGVVNLVYGVPAEISTYLIPHPVIRKISFTGSTV